MSVITHRSDGHHVVTHHCETRLRQLVFTNSTCACPHLYTLRVPLKTNEFAVRRRFRRIRHGRASPPISLSRSFSCAKFSPYNESNFSANGSRLWCATRRGIDLLVLGSRRLLLNARAERYESLRVQPGKATYERGNEAALFYNVFRRWAKEICATGNVLKSGRRDTGQVDASSSLGRAKQKTLVILKC